MLKLEQVSKKFQGNDFYSLEKVDFTVNQGDIVGLIGKNGVGKSTLLKLIAKSLKPTQGNIFYMNQDINQKENALTDFGIMIDPVFYPEMTVVENLEFYLELHNKAEYRNNIEKTLKLVDLWHAKDRKPKGFSFGMKQRTALAIALVAEPSFLLLDEPFVGLDPIGVQQLIDILKYWSQERNISMIISSHQLGELEALCNRYVYIDNGHLVDNLEVSAVPSILVKLTHEVDLGINKDLVKYSNNGHQIEIPINLTANQQNAIWLTLASQDGIQSIDIKDNHLKDFFK